MQTSRREFLKSVAQAGAVISVGSQIPWLWQQAAADSALKSGERILVVLQLSGGNDGLNTVVPYKNEAYRKARPKLAIPANDVLKINDDFGFHPAARGLANLLESSRLAILQGVGYPEPNRSHFESMDIWHTCARKGGPRTTGWLGRAFDGDAGSSRQDTVAIHLGESKQPLALTAEQVRVPSISSPEKFRLREEVGGGVAGAVRDAANADNAANEDLLGFVQTSTSSALDASERITAALKQYQTPVAYPDNAMAAKFKTVAQLITAGLKTRVYYLELDGFDTHSQQAAAHAALLQQAGGSLQAFLDDLKHHGLADQVLVMCFSEFGRRVQENASEGTDHGAAAPMFLAGNRVKSGLIGDLPSLSDLDDGDLKFHTDFRQVYATVLETWLEWDSQRALGGEYKGVPAIDAT